MLSEDNEVMQTTQYQSKGENMNRKKKTYHVVTRRLAFALLEIRLAFGLQRKPSLISKEEMTAII